MTANRSYRGKDTPLMVFALMQHGSFGVLDPVVLKVFLENITNYFVGSRVRLNTGETGEIVFMNSMDYAKPVIIIKDRYIDIAVSKDVRIEEFL
jgi:HD-GYP domain-containing protein (c-di-GMP phosphodiesterase class II)